MVERSTPSGKKLVSKTGAVSRIATLRERLGMTQQQLAVFVGVTTNTIQNWEKGTSGVDQIEKFLKLCAVLNCDLKDLIEYSDPQPAVAKGFSVDELRELRKKWLGDEAENINSKQAQSTKRKARKRMGKR